MDAFSFDGRLMQKMAEKNIAAATAVQKAVVPVIRGGDNCLFESETGTGKTFAYLLPLVQRLYFESGYDAKPKQERYTAVIIAAPTKELAVQIKNELSFLLGGDEKLLVCFGGSSIKRHIESLREKPFAVVGSPNRLSDLIRLKRIKAQNVQALVFDEADRLLERETEDASLELIRSLPKTIQFIACSATMNEAVRHGLSSLLETAEIGLAPDTKTQCIILPKENILTQKIAHWALYAEDRDKLDTLRSFLAAEKPEKVLVFCPTSADTDKTAEYLSFKKVPSFALHAGTDKVKRKQALDKFKSGSCKVLVTSDLAARGLDIAGITHIIQMGVPSNPDFFVHRAGRTARSDTTGINLIIGNAHELHELAHLEKKLYITVYPKELYEGKLISADDDCC
ncbi:DEAD/DEAH box helicase [Treponema sp. HNW]|uniref:DEAD/DEAH box helicase n=1 Tax=Treponema sp. HNW TaxID=3116654 RepID=UPI003D0A3B3E